jgi:hypothetical protein
MNRRSIFTLSAITALGLALLPSSIAVAQGTLRQQLTGSWTRVSAEDTSPDGTKHQYFGANPKGLMVLDPSGRYITITMRPDRPKFKASNNLRLDTSAAEYAEAARAYAAAFGTWSVNEADKTLTIKTEGALISNAEGAEGKASISLAGDELKLLTTTAAGGKVEGLYRRAK